MKHNPFYPVPLVRRHGWATHGFDRKVTSLIKLLKCSLSLTFCFLKFGYWSQWKKFYIRIESKCFGNGITIGVQIILKIFKYWQIEGQVDKVLHSLLVQLGPVAGDGEAARAEHALLTRGHLTPFSEKLSLQNYRSCLSTQLFFKWVDIPLNLAKMDTWKASFTIKVFKK